MNSNGVVLRVRGKVQGVGFRPFVWQLAQQLGLHGDVRNDGAGVEIRLLLPIHGFIYRLRTQCPPLAHIDAIEQTDFHWPSLPETFSIRESAAGTMDTQIIPDATTCPSCLAEMNNPNDRRYCYPFINCTHCGPRITIIKAMPYDRPNTVMASFPLCPACDQEYRDPADRRFHAQPVACPECGPTLEWQSEQTCYKGETALQAALAALKAGKIIAIKGLGGFHLAVDAGNDQAIRQLRLRKRRPSKPLAVMLPDDNGLSPLLTRWLHSPIAPIVLVPKSDLPLLSTLLAPDLNELGVMLPSNPLQHLLMQEMGRPLVMTSGNLNGRSPALTNEQVQIDLATIADGFLMHNRDIVQRMDDSVMRPNGEVLRRARGFVPDAFSLPPGFDQVPAGLCMGADLKNTFCMVRGGHAVISQHLGDLSEEGVEPQWRKALRLMTDIYQFEPSWVAVDGHTGYQSSRLGRGMGLPVHEILHHHAHIAACMAEHQWPLDGGPVIGLALDGIGMGAGGQLWGGECLRVDYHSCTRLGGLPAVALPGSDVAARQPWRNLLAHCMRFVPGWEHYSETDVIRRQIWEPLARAINRGINAPKASSTGRLFDAVAAALGCTPLQQSYEGEAAGRLQALAQRHGPVAHPIAMTLEGNELDLAGFWRRWMAWRASPGARAWAFHDALAAGFAKLAATQACQQEIQTIVCAGGVMHNALMRERLRHHLSEFQVLFPQELPAGDGAISFGQAVIAAAHLSHSR